MGGVETRTCSLDGKLLEAMTERRRCRALEVNVFITPHCYWIQSPAASIQWSNGFVIYF